MKKRTQNIFIFAILLICTNSIYSQIDGTIYFDGIIQLQLTGGFDNGTSLGDSRNIYCGFNYVNNNNSCQPSENGSNARLYLYKGNTIIEDFGELCTGVAFHLINWDVPELTPGDDYRFRFYCDWRPTSSCCANFYSVYSDYFIVGEDPTIITPENNTTHPIDLTFEWSSTDYDDKYLFIIDLASENDFSFSCSSENVNNEVYSEIITTNTYQIPDGILENNESYIFQIVAKQFGKCFTARSVFSTTGPLPVEITNLFLSEVSHSENYHVLTWQVESEVNINEYQIEFSTNAINFQKIGHVDANNAHEYSFRNDIMYNSNSDSYYRLKIVEVDGSYYYSKIIHSQKILDQKDLVIFPNPCIDKINLKIPQGVNEVAIRILNSNGVEILRPTLSTNHIIDISNLKTGLYILEYLDMETNEINYNRFLRM